MKYLIALAAFLSSVSAFAQAKPADVQVYVPVAATYESGSTLNQIGDGSNAWGGTLPAEAKSPAEVPTPVETRNLWVLNAAAFKDIAALGTNTPGNTGLDGSEAKARFISGQSVSHILPDDPVRNYCQPGASHWHTFFGTISLNACSTYTTIRTRANAAGATNKIASTMSGGPLNATGYWVPTLIKTNPFSDGKNYGVKPENDTIYYEDNPFAKPNTIPRGVRYVLGVNMDDPLGTGVAAEIAAANAQVGTTGRYQCLQMGAAAQLPLNSPEQQAACIEMNGFLGWKCQHPVNGMLPVDSGGTYARWLKNANGTDPWMGGCTSGSLIIFEALAPECYDGVNIWAPGGYKHFRRALKDTFNGNAAACPKTWVRVPTLRVLISYKTTGFSDYGNWRQSSDDMAAALAGVPFQNGRSGHTDWFDGWHWPDRVSWMQFCAGIKGSTPHECDNSTISQTQLLVGASNGDLRPDGITVNLTPNFSTATAGGMLQVPAVTKGPITIQAKPK